MKRCPICGSAAIECSVHRDSLPVFQNVVWPTREAARAAPCATFTLGTCRDCGFSFNAEFDAGKVIYDERYDNNVPSPAFRSYYQSLIDMLTDRLDLRDGTVYDVGCGKGEFLEMLCASAPDVRGIGIDPSCTPVQRGNLRLIREFLQPSHFVSDTRLVVVRHVLEHIGEPVAFLEMVSSCVPDVPVFVEVPDLGWILRETAFWDFCYEHCNYFTLPSLATCLRAAGFIVNEQQLSFGEQYQWALCRPGAPVRPPHDAGRAAVEAVRAYANREAQRIEDLQQATERAQVAVWGMATKGVTLCAILGAEQIAGGVDVNPTKQGRFAAGSGVRINPPDWMRELPPGTETLVMNPNYQVEVAETARTLGVDIRLIPV